ncbi:hypothetical protein BDZ88DRAFT_433765 [Geranomyces variabilis]|nr:hypothetical protein BDZ88DRAFT_433765 [Geranomyces variabilis]
MWLYRTLKYQLYNYPTIFASYVLGITGPVLLLTVYPMRREMGYRPAPNQPRSYPLPDGARTFPDGYED